MILYFALHIRVLRRYTDCYTDFIVSIDAAKPAFFERNFAWHAITPNEGDVTSKRNNATIMFLKPIVYPQNQERFGQLRTTYNLNEDPQIMTIFYFDLALRTFITIK